MFGSRFGFEGDKGSDLGASARLVLDGVLKTMLKPKIRVNGHYHFVPVSDCPFNPDGGRKGGITPRIPWNPENGIMLRA